MDTQPFMPTRAQWERAQTQLAAVTAERDAARAEVARLREVIERKAGALSVFAQHTGLSTGMCLQWRDEFLAALRGDTAPAGRE